LESDSIVDKSKGGHKTEKGGDAYEINGAVEGERKSRKEKDSEKENL